MRFLLGGCLLFLACPARLGAQDRTAPGSPPEDFLLAPRELPELNMPRAVEAPLEASPGVGLPEAIVPSEIIPQAPPILPPATPPAWVQNLRFPRQPYPRPLVWWYGSGPDDAAAGNWFSREWDVTCGEACDTCHRLWRDFQFQYSCYSLCELAVAVGLAAPLANTRADQEVANWYQSRIRTQSTDQWTRPAYYLGYYQYMLPIYFGVWAAGRLADDTFAGAVSADWASRSLRALAIGAPEVGILQYVLGGSRPSDFLGSVRPPDYWGSRWRPLNDNNGVSGHAFVGAIPFLTAASMCENPWCRGALFVGSFWTAWSRVNTDSHYLSQVLLGWFIAYQSVRSVNRTEAEERIQFSPWLDPGITGINVTVRY